MIKRPAKPESTLDSEDSTQYHNFLQRKVDAARRSLHKGEGRSNEEIETEYAAKRAQAAE
jgi:hypothetical protein